MRILLALGLAFALLTTGAADARPFTARDLAMLDRIGETRLSPDGRWVAYTVRSTDWDANKGVTAIWLLDRTTPGAAPVLLVANDKGGSSPRWSSNGRSIYFLSARSGSNQVWRIGPDGKGLTQITALPMDVGLFKLSGDGRTMVLTGDVYPDCETLACTRAKEDARAKQKATGQLFNGTSPRFWDAYQDERFVSLFAIRLDNGGAPSEATLLLRGYKADVPDTPFGDESALALSPDGGTLWFSAPPSGALRGLNTPNSLYVVPTDGSKPPVPVLPGTATSQSRPTLSPDGRQLAWIAESGSTVISQRSAVMVRDLRTGATREVAPNWDIGLNRLVWSGDGKRLLVTAQSVGQVRLFALEVATGKATPLSQDGSVGDYDTAAGALVYVRDGLEGPGQIYDLTGAAPRQLTTVNAEALKEVEFGAAEQFTFTGWNGETVHAYVVKPHGFDPAKRYPVAFLIHGGPHGSFGNAWSYRWNPQVWAGMGYAVVMVDFHGSTGYGTAFAQSIVGHWGDRPLEDLQKGWAAALSRYGWLDGNRACALGGSYGGYMVAWIAGNWGAPWRCLVNHAGVFDTRSMAYSTDIPGFSEGQMDGLTWMDRDPVDRFNPAMFVQNWKTPMLVIHGARDYRVPLDQGVGAYTAALRLQVPTQFLVYPDENHWILKPQNSVQWYGAVEAWMDRWTAEAPG